MKMRSDFVTNSSSSSFVVINIGSKQFSEILSNFSKELQKIFSDTCLIEDDSVSLASQTVLNGSVPEGISEVINYFIELLEEEIDCCEIEDLDDLVELLKDEKESLEKSLESVEWLSTDYGWDGDDTSRFDMELYSEKRLEEIKNEIIAQNPTIGSVDAITEDDFQNYVLNKTSVAECRLKYDRSLNILENSYDFRLE